MVFGSLPLRQERKQVTNLLNFHTMTRDQQIASTIINQLGGLRRLNIMVGIKDLFAIENGVSFKIKFAGAVANYVKVQLNGNDLYDIEVGKIRGDKYTVKASEQDVHVSDMKTLIENTCKVRLSL